MEYLYTVKYSERRGASPQWDEKTIEMLIDDVPDDVQGSKLFDMMKWEFRDFMRRKGIHQNAYILKEVEAL